MENKTESIKDKCYEPEKYLDNEDVNGIVFNEPLAEDEVEELFFEQLKAIYDEKCKDKRHNTDIAEWLYINEHIKERLPESKGVYQKLQDAKLDGVQKGIRDTDSNWYYFYLYLIKFSHMQDIKLVK